MTHQAGKHFVSRVPMTLTLAHEACYKANQVELEKIKAGYQAVFIRSEDGEIPQKWLVVKSDQAHYAQSQTFEKIRTKPFRKKKCGLRNLLGKALLVKAMLEKHCYIDLVIQVSKVQWLTRNCTYQVLRKQGRPKINVIPTHYKYKVKVLVPISEEAVAKASSELCRFIIANNDLSEEIDMLRLLDRYKS